MNRKADRIRRTHASTESSHALKGRELRSFRPFPASAEPSPLEHSLGKIALLPATAAAAPVFQANPNRAEIVPDNQVPGMTIQAKLMIGAPGDKFEQKADRVATQVVRQIQEPEPRASVREQAVQREEIQGKDHQVESRPMSVNAPSGVITRSAPPHLEPSIHQARGGGQPLPNPIRVPMEQAFGADFSGVRIHADAGSDELASSIQAESFTRGRDVYFRQGAYEPRSRGGQELLAHELNHVVQQLPHDQEHLEDDQSSAESIPRDLVDQGGGGQPPPQAVRVKMERLFNTSFADVRVHVGHEAPSIGALAFTHGTDLYFAPGQYNPQSTQGQRLLGHELTHVVQQRAGRVRNPLGTGVAVVQDPALEAEAERMGLRAASAALPIQAKALGTSARTQIARGSPIGPSNMMSPVAAQPRSNPAASSGSSFVSLSPPMREGQDSYRIVAGVRGQPVGSVMVHARGDSAIEVSDLKVNSSHRGRGLGGVLLSSALEAGRQLGRSRVVLGSQDEGSGRLTQWYRRMGFAQVGVNREGYPDLEAPITRVLSGGAQRRTITQAALGGEASAPRPTQSQGRLVVSPPSITAGRRQIKTEGVLQRMEAPQKKKFNSLTPDELEVLYEALDKEKPKAPPKGWPFVKPTCEGVLVKNSVENINDNAKKLQQLYNGRNPAVGQNKKIVERRTEINEQEKATDAGTGIWFFKYIVENSGRPKPNVSIVFKSQYTTTYEVGLQGAYAKSYKIIYNIVDKETKESFFVLHTHWATKNGRNTLICASIKIAGMSKCTYNEMTEPTGRLSTAGLKYCLPLDKGEVI